MLMIGLISHGEPEEGIITSVGLHQLHELSRRLLQSVKFMQVGKPPTNYTFFGKSTSNFLNFSPCFESYNEV